MKKILFALVAMVGLAHAYPGEDFNDILAEKLEEANYDASMPYTISFQVRNTPISRAFFTLDNNYFLVNEQHVYWGINNKDSNEMTLNRDWTFRAIDNEYTLTSLPGQRLISWVQTPNGNASGKRQVGEHLNVEIKCDGNDTRIRLKYDIDQRVDTFNLKGVALDASNFRAAGSIDMNRVRIKISNPDAPVRRSGRGGFIRVLLISLVAFIVGFVCGRKFKKKDKKPAAKPVYEEEEAEEEAEEYEEYEQPEETEEAAESSPPDNESR